MWNCYEENEIIRMTVSFQSRMAIYQVPDANHRCQSYLNMIQPVLTIENGLLV